MTLRGTSRIGKIIEYLKKHGGQEHADLYLIDLYLLEVNGYETNVDINNSGFETNEESINETSKINGNDIPISRPKRQVANDARDKIY